MLCLSPTFYSSCFLFLTHCQGSSKLKYNLKVSNRAIKRPILTASTHSSASLSPPFSTSLSLSILSTCKLHYKPEQLKQPPRHNHKYNCRHMCVTVSVCLCACVSQHVLMHSVCAPTHTAQQKITKDALLTSSKVPGRQAAQSTAQSKAKATVKSVAYF